MKFFSKHQNLRLVLEPTIVVMESGQRTMKGMNNRYPTGMTVEFQSGQFETTDKKIIEDLKSHADYGLKFHSDDSKGETPSEEGIKRQNEEKAMAEKLASKCPNCGKEFDTEFALKGHMRTHKDEE